MKSISHRKELRFYQNDFIYDIRQAIKKHKRALCVMPTGAGKTVVFCHLIKQAIAKQKRVLVVTHRNEIFRQIKLALYDEGIASGSIVAGRLVSNHNLCSVGMVMTIANRLSRISRPDLIIFDEAHHCKAATWMKIIEYWQDAYLLGFTATPERLDGKGLGDIFDKIVEGATIRKLVEWGFLTEPVMYGVKAGTGLDKKYKTQAGDYSKEQQEEILQAQHGIIYGRMIQEYTEKLGGLPAIAFTPTIASAENVALQFREAGYSAIAVHSKMTTAQRNDAINGLGTGKYNVVSSCDVISEGVDVPIVAGVLLLRKTKSLAYYLQACGRGLRPFPGKKSTIILDHANNFAEHGHVMDQHIWSLEGRKKKDHIAITECPKCYFVMPGRPSRCRSCGYTFVTFTGKTSTLTDREKAIVPIDLRLLPSALDADLLRKNLEHACRQVSGKAKNKLVWREAYRIWRETEDDRQDTHTALLAMSKALGYKPGWCKIVWDHISQTEKKNA